MSLPPPAYIPALTISFKMRGRARLFDSSPEAENADLEFRERRPEILKRDKYTCGCCGIVTQPSAGKESGGGLEVHHLSGDHHDNRWENLLSLCPICHAILHFWFSALKGPYRKAMLILHLPWISQADLNLMSWGIAVVRHRCSALESEGESTSRERLMAREIEETAEEIQRLLIDNGRFPDDFFPPGCSKGAYEALGNAANLAMALRGIARGHADEFSERETLLQGIRVFFHPDHLKDAARKFSAMPAWLPGPGPKWAVLWQAASDGRRA